MPITINTLQKVSLSVIVLFSIFSCSKDADLLSEYVITQDDTIQSITLLADDSFFMTPGQNTILMDVLNNDNISQNSNVTIVETSTPINGTVTINEDNTLTYISQVEEPVEESSVTEESQAEPEEDTFTYTAEVVDEETGNTTKEEATVTVSATSANLDMGELKAFPEAEGFGKFTTGGRGGIVIHVTNLNDSGPGSLRSALLTKGTRTIVFDVGGNINLASQLELGNGNGSTNSYENVTIAGETAPFPGITITGGFGLNISTSNVIMRYITIRSNGTSDTSSLNLRNWGTNGYIMENLIIDHVTLSHGGDANMDFFSASDAAYLGNVTLQNSMMHKGKGSGNCLVGQYTKDISILRNYYSHNANRNPLIGYGTGTGIQKEYINNIVFGGNSALTISRGNIVDGIANIFKSFENNQPIYNVYNLGSIGYNNIVGTGSIFIDGNFVSGSLNGGTFYGSELLTYNSGTRVVSGSNVTSWLTTQSEIENSVLPTVGNSIHRDKLDTEYINAYAGSTGDYSIPTIPEKSSASRENDYDTDNDGMADEWERSNYGNLSNTANGDENNNGYTNLEEFFYFLRN